MGLVWDDPANTLQFVLIKPDALKYLCVVGGDGGEGLEWSEGSACVAGRDLRGSCVWKCRVAELD